VEQAEWNGRALVAGSDVAVQWAAAPGFVPVPLETKNGRPGEIRVEVRRSDQLITVNWPASEAAQCAA
jgi:hypothetical protein